MAKQAKKPTLEQHIMDTIVSGLKAKKGFVAFKDAYDVLTNYATNATYTAKTYQKQPALKIEHEDYSGSNTFYINKTSNIADKIGKIKGQLSFQPQDTNNNATATIAMQIKAKSVAKHLGFQYNSKSSPALLNKFKIVLAPDNPNDPLIKRKFHYDSVQYTAAIVIPKIGVFKLYQSP